MSAEPRFPADGAGGRALSVRGDQEGILAKIGATKWLTISRDPGRCSARVFDQKECVFSSHVLPVRVGQTVVIKNSDPIGHNTNVTTQADVNINPLLPPGRAVET